MEKLLNIFTCVTQREAQDQLSGSRGTEEEMMKVYFLARAHYILMEQKSNHCVTQNFILIHLHITLFSFNSGPFGETPKFTGKWGVWIRPNP